MDILDILIARALSTGASPEQIASAVQAYLEDNPLDASDVGALPDDTPIPTKTSDLTNDSGFQTSTQVQDAIKPFEIHIIDDGNGGYTTQESAVEIIAHAENCVAVFDGGNYSSSLKYVDANTVDLGFFISNPLETGVVYAEGFNVAASLPTRVEVNFASRTLVEIPVVNDTDNGKFLRVADGAWTAEAGDEYDAYLALPTDTASGAIASFPDGAGDAAVKSLVATIKPVQSGSGDPSPDNIRPITGFTGCAVSRTGKNLLNLARTLGNPVPTGIGNTTSPRVFDLSKYYEGTQSANFYYKAYVTASVSPDSVAVTLNDGNSRYGVGFPVAVIGGNTYTFSATASDGGVSFGYYDKSWNYLSTSADYQFSLQQSVTVTVPSNAAFMVIVLRTIGVGNTTIITNPQLELGSAATAYEPYQGNTYNITFPAEAGTVYGGTLDVTSGVLTVTHAFAVLDGTQNILWENWRGTETSAAWQYNGNAFNIKKIDRNTTGNVISNKLKSISYNQMYTGAISDSISASPSDVTQNYSIIVRVSNPSLTTKEMINAYLAENPIQICYELANPITYQLDPVTVTTLLGVNNIQADTGDVAVDYRADTGLYIQKLTGSTEEDMIADAPIASGKYFLVGNTLYLSTAAIAAGATLTPGTNCVKTNLAEALNALNS